MSILYCKFLTGIAMKEYSSKSLQPKIGTADVSLDRLSNNYIIIGSL